MKYLLTDKEGHKIISDHSKNHPKINFYPHHLLCPNSCNYCPRHHDCYRLKQLLSQLSYHLDKPLGVVCMVLCGLYGMVWYGMVCVVCMV